MAQNITHGMTYVTQPAMPPIAEFTPYLEAIWRNRQLTNCGPLHQELEAQLADHLGVPHVALIANGTLALMIALQALDLKGEVVTTPFSFVATSHALRWLGLEPVFADIDPATCNIDPAAVEAAITPRTAAILPVHCFGHPCANDALQAVADRHGIPVLYDAAHAFGVRNDGVSVLQHGALSVLSFHATKVFNTFEGGAIVCHDAAMHQRIASLRNFGFVDATMVGETGLNAKMSEIHAAFGLLQLQHLPSALAKRQRIAASYEQGLRDADGIATFPTRTGVTPNPSYSPILVAGGSAAIAERLRERGIVARRYFPPLICDMPAYRGSAPAEALPHARRIADEILCLPLYPDLSEDIVAEVVAIIRTATARPDRQAA